MDWKSVLKNVLMLMPNLISSADAIRGSGADKKTKVLQGVMVGLDVFKSADPESFDRVFNNTHVQKAIGDANDAIHFALKTVDTVSAGLPAPTPAPVPPPKGDDEPRLPVTDNL